ncbi:MAG: hypothetical protein JWL81_3076 [Verrucomicrobiales bacterium]|nr:hypothetical protein [Verrucomicrobiales bacterium]
MHFQDLSSNFHQRLHLPDYEEKLKDIDPRKLDTGEADSPNQVWARERLREKLNLAEVDKSPVDLLVWGIGGPDHPAGTKIGGLPVWPAGRPLPLEDRNDWETPSPLRFFAQINFADSLDILPELPGKVLSIWGGEEFPYEGSVKTFWLELEDLEFVTDYSPGFDGDFMPSSPIFAALHRTWDRSRHQELLDETAAEEGVPVEDCARSWMASKIGGRACRIQQDSGLGPQGFFLQIKSVEPADGFPHAWVSEPELKIMGSKQTRSPKKVSLSLSDGGAIYFFLSDWGAVETVFDFH